MEELRKIQAELKAPKNMYNSFGKYKYRNAEAILEAVKPLLDKNKCTLTISDEIVEIGGRIYVKATTLLKNASGDSESCTAYAREPEGRAGMDAAQVTGSSSSYARKYALNGLLCIDDTKDPDTTNTGGWEDEINQAVTKNELSKIYEKHTELHNDKEFMSALTARREQIEKEQARRNK